MARKTDLFINIILLFILLCTAKCSKLNVPRVLLPIFNDFSTNFTLEVTDGGCYKWTTSRLDLVQLTPLDIHGEEECSTRVVVLTVTKDHSRSTAIVLAEDVHTRQVLRCDVIVDVIFSLNIVTTTRELFMEEAPEAFEVRAYDEQGNEFSTLEGVEFEWFISSPGSAEDSVLRFITFKDSPYETPHSVKVFDEIGKQGHIILLEGVKTGSTKVSARLPHQEYKKLNGIEVSLMVIANLIIEPADVYILRGDVVRYKIIQVKQGRLEEINIPSSQYKLVSDNPDIGLIETNTGYLTGINVGKTRIYLQDNNVEEDTTLKLPSAVVYVTFPDRLVLTLLPHRNWATLLNEQHDIAVELYASNEHKMYIGEGVILNTIIDEAFFKPSFRSANGSFISGTTVQQGPSVVHTVLLSVISTKLGTVLLEPKLTAQAELLIHSRIKLSPAEILFPWDPIVKPKYEIQLKVEGGDSKYLWSTTNNSVGIVTQAGLVKTHFQGQFDTCASMLRNHHNRDCSKFFIVPPSRLEIVEFVMEGEVGVPIFIHIALFGERPKGSGDSVPLPFTNCKEIPLRVKTSDSNFYYDESATSALVGISCTSVAVVGLVVGTSRVTVQYIQGDIHLEQTVTISTFRPLQVLHPPCAETVLALGTSRYLIFTGGPRPWSGRPSDHIMNIVTNNPNIVKVTDSTKEFKVPGGSDTYILHILCKDIGEASITLTVYNKPTASNCVYKESSAEAKVFCAQPQYMVLYPEIKVPDISSCPMDLSAERVIVQSYRNIDLIIGVKDHFGRRFDNISSLYFNWKLKPNDLVTIENADETFEKAYYEDNVKLPNKTYQILVPMPNNQGGLVDVEASIMGYKQKVFKINRINHVSSFEPVTAKITLYLVDDTIVLPNKTSIYNHPLNKQSLIVKQGSGYNELILNTKDIADVMYNEGLRRIEISPKQNGELRMTVRDLCLKSPPVDIVLNVVHVSTIRVEMADRVEYGRCIPVIVKFYDEFDNLMPLPKLEYLDVRYTLADKIVNLKLTDPSEIAWDVGEIHYILAGFELGETKLIFSAGRGPKEVSSLPVDIQVFSPLKLSPRNATLLVGSILQFNAQGGPQPDTNIEYTLESEDVAEISTNGILRARNIGQTKVVARSVSINPITGKKVTNSKDTVEVYVIPLLGIKISAPLTRFVEGTTVPVWASGVPERLSTLLIGSVDPPFSFVWGSRCNDILSVTGIFESVGIKDSLANKVSVRVKGLQPGQCGLELNVTVSGVAAGKKKKSTVIYSASIDMEVIAGFYLSAPKGFNGKAFLMAPFSVLKLETNKDGLSTLKYSVRGEEQGDDNDKSVTIPRVMISVNNDGTVISYGVIGRAMIVITARDEHGLKQTLSLVIQIKPVHYLLLTISTSWMIPPEEDINVVPLGASFKIIVSYHDNTGAEFSAAKCDLSYRTSRHDLLEVKRNPDNITFTAYTVNAGSTVLKVWADNCFKTADFIQIFAGQIAKPRTDSITSGDVLCMHCCVRDKSGNTGTWSSGPENLVVVNASSGVGQVSSSTTNRIFIQYDLTPNAKIGVDVEPVSEISFVFDNTQSVTNTPNTTFHVSIVLKDEKHPNKTSNMLVGRKDCSDVLDKMINFPFLCIIEFEKQSELASDIFNVQPAFNKETGLYSCDIISTAKITANTSMIGSNIILRVVSDNGIQSSPLKIKFLPAVYVPTEELVVNDVFSTTLSITGLPEVLTQVTVIPVDKALIEIGEVNHIAPNMDNYEIKLIDYHWKLEELKEPMSVIITSKATNQVIKIQVKLGDKSSAFCAARGAVGGSPLGNFLYDNRQLLSILTSMIILIFVTFYAYSHYMQPVINVNVASGRPQNLFKSHVIGGERALMGSPQQLNTRTYGCGPQTCQHRSFNVSNSPTMRYGSNEVLNSSRGLGNSPEQRRNRRFL